MFVYQLLVFALVVLAGCLALGVNPYWLSQSISLDDEVILRFDRERIIAKKPNRFELLQAQLLYLLGMAKVSHQTYIIQNIWAIFGGCLIGYFLFYDFLLAVITGICMVPLPIIYLVFRTRKIKRREVDSLEHTMSVITNSYLSSEDIVAAIETFLNQKNSGLDPRMRRMGPFDQFLAEIYTINPSIEKGLQKLALHIDNSYFHEWINMLVLCQSNRELRFALQPIIKAMATSKNIQIEASSKLAEIWRDYLLVLTIMFIVIPFLRVVNPPWYNILTMTAGGRLILIGMLMASMLSAFYVIHITRPIDQD